MQRNKLPYVYVNVNYINQYSRNDELAFTPNTMSSQFQPRDPDFRDRVTRSFTAQAVMQTLNAALVRVDAGEVDIELPYQSGLTQQDGYLHAGISSTIMDSACGYAAFSLMPAEARVLTIEFKINLLAPADGDRFRAEGKVRKSGRSVSVAEAELFAYRDGAQRLVASMVGTLMAVYPREKS